MTQTPNDQWRQRLETVMPFGSSTCSKRAGLCPEEPAVIVRGKGCRVWDADGREFIDFRNGLGPVTLGYRYPAVEEAVRKQLEQGIVFGHPHPLEAEVAELISEVVPCAEQTRFLKTGGEAVAACIKLARAWTGRDHVIQIGYNGWLNSLAGSGQMLPGQAAPKLPPGVPRAQSDLHHTGPWNDPQRLEQLFAELDGRVAALVVAASYPAMDQGADVYPFLRRLVDRHGALLIFDEIVTGFRVALAGVQEYFGVTPDLAVFAKGVANGMPLSVYCGRRDVMDGCYQAVISSTYGGETLSLAAARACIETYRTEGVIDHIWRTGQAMWEGLSTLFRQHGVPAVIRGLWPCPQIVFEGDKRKELSSAFLRAAFKHGVSLYRTGYVNFSHRDTDIAEALDKLDAALKEL